MSGNYRILVITADDGETYIIPTNEDGLRNVHYYIGNFMFQNGYNFNVEKIEEYRL